MVLRKLAATSTAADLTIVYEAIDLRLKEMHRLGTFWRKVTKVPLSFTVSAGVNSATATADVLFPVSMTALNLSMDDPIEIIGVRQYAEISNKADTGQPQQALYQGSGSFVFWPVPITNTTIKLTYEKIADDTAVSTQPDVEVSMLRWLKDIIAYDLGDEFGKNESTMERWRRDSLYAENQIRKLNLENVDHKTVEALDF